MTVKTRRNVTTFKDAVSEQVSKAAAISAERLEALQNKAVLRDEAKAALSDARKALDTIESIHAINDDKAKEAREAFETATGKAAFSLFRMEATGVSSKEETSSLLGETFGFKVKKDGSPSKTPDGQGEVIRKRIVRAVDAYNFVHRGNATAFLQPLTGHAEAMEEASQMVADMIAGDVPIFTAYDRLDKLVKEYKDKPEPLHLNAERIRKDMVQKMADLNVVHRLALDETLRNAYAELIGSLQAVLQGAESIGQTDQEEAMAA